MAQEEKPIELLEEIHEKIVQETNVTTHLKSRIPLKDSQIKREILKTVAKNGEMTASDIKKEVTNPKVVTKELCRLYRAYHLDRRERDGVYYYSITTLGNKAIGQLENLNDFVDNSSESNANQPSHPWEKTDLTRSQYITLEILADMESYGKSKEINKEYLNRMNVPPSDGSSIKVTPRLTELIDMEYAIRTKHQPYLYEISEDGKEIIND